MTARTPRVPAHAWCRVVFGAGLRSLFSFEDQRHLDEVLAEEPGLEFVGAEDVADDEVVGALLAGLVGGFGDVEAALDDDLVGLEEAGDLDGNLFPAAGRAGMRVISAASPPMAMVTPPRSCTRSPMVSTISTCSSKCLSKRRWSW